MKTATFTKNLEKIIINYDMNRNEIGFKKRKAEER